MKFSGGANMYSRNFAVTVAMTSILSVAAPSLAGPEQIRQVLESEARAQSGFAGFSVDRGREFFHSKHGADWSCSTCHTDNPAAKGRHAKTNKDIAPLAPAANGDRFNDPAKVAKWFRRNCNDVVGRPCSAQEQGDILTYLMSIKN